MFFIFFLLQFSNDCIFTRKLNETRVINVFLRVKSTVENIVINFILIILKNSNAA